MFFCAVQVPAEPADPLEDGADRRVVHERHAGGGKTGFFGLCRSFNPGSFYSGTVAALVFVVIWVYYAAIIFIIGGEVAQVYELRRVRQMQREAFED